MLNRLIINTLRFFKQQELLPDDPGINALLSIDLKKGDLVIDCGANIGETVSLIAKSGVEVHAFEANSHAFKVLEERFRDKPDVHCYKQAVLDQCGSVNLYHHIHSHGNEVKWSGGSSIFSEKPNVNKNKFEEVESIDLSAFIAQLDKSVSVLKMDIEGAEIQVLEKMIEDHTISRVRNLFVEIHDKKIPQLREAGENLRSKLKTIESLNVVSWR